MSIIVEVDKKPVDNQDRNSAMDLRNMCFFIL